VVAPTARIGTITDDERKLTLSRSPVGAKYDTPVNRESVAEMLAKRAEEKAANAPEQAAKDASKTEQGDWGNTLRDALLGTKRRQGMLEAAGKSMLRSIGSGLGRQIVRGVLGGILGGSRR